MTNLVSVIMPAYNAENYIARAISSILSQTYRNFELIIVDDCSTDKTMKIISQYEDPRIKVLKNKNNLMVSKTKNKAIKEAKGEYIVSMDADDISVENRLELLVKFMEENPEIGICGSYVDLINSNEKIIGQRTYPLEDLKIRKFIFKFSPYTHGAVCIRRTILDRIDFYNPKYDFVEDRELFFRIGVISRFANLNKNLYQLRIHSESVSAKKQKLMELKCNQLCWKYLLNKAYPFSLINLLFLSIQRLAVYIVPANIINLIYKLIRQDLSIGYGESKK